MFEIRVLMANGQKPSSTTTEDKNLAKILINSARDTGCPVLVLQDGRIIKQYNNARIAEEEACRVQYWDRNLSGHEKEFYDFFEARKVLSAIEAHGFYGRILINGEIASEVNRDLKIYCIRRMQPRLTAGTADVPVSVKRHHISDSMLEEVKYTSGREAWFFCEEPGSGFVEIRPSEAAMKMDNARKSRTFRGKSYRENQAKLKAAMAIAAQLDAEEAYAEIVAAMPADGGVAHKLIRTING